MKAFESAFARLPADWRSARAPLFETLRARGLPSKKDEDWKYTDLSGLAQRSFEPAAAPAHRELPSLPGAETVAFVNGHCLSPKMGSDPIFHQKIGPDPNSPEIGPDPILGGVAALNAVFATAGLDLVVPANTMRAPLHLLTWFGGAAGEMAHLRHRIRLERGAHAVLVVDVRCDEASGDGAGFLSTQVFDIELAENSQLALYRVQGCGSGATMLSRTDVRMGRDSRCTAVGFFGGNGLSRNDINISLDAPGAAAEIHGVIAPRAGDHVDVHTRLDHRAPHGRSRESFRALVPAKARAIFNGKVVVHPGAQKTDSEQHVDSLLLAPGAEANAKPELEIYADDVKCAHGATCGQLDEQVLYYLRTRGLPLDEARNLLLYTFAQEILQKIAFEPARQLAQAALGLRLPGVADPGSLA